MVGCTRQIAGLAEEHGGGAVDERAGGGDARPVREDAFDRLGLLDCFLHAAWIPAQSRGHGFVKVPVDPLRLKLLHEPVGSPEEVGGNAKPDDHCDGQGCAGAVREFVPSDCLSKLVQGAGRPGGDGFVVQVPFQVGG